MKKVTVVASILLMAFAASAHANFLTNPSFEVNGGAGTDPAGWTKWTDRGSFAGVESDASSPLAADGNWVAGIHGPNLNGGYFQVANVPIGVPLTLDGIWASHPTSSNSQWGEVIVFDGAIAYAGGDINPDGGTPDGNLLNGELIYKNDTFASPNGWNGVISATAPVQNNPVPLISTTGQFTVVIKGGNAGANQGTDFDAMTLTPEPSALALLMLGIVPMLRRRRA